MIGRPVSPGGFNNFNEQNYRSEFQGRYRNMELSGPSHKKGKRSKKRKRIGGSPLEPKTKRRKKAPKEKRQGRFRSKCPMWVEKKMRRALSQRMYLINRDPVSNTKETFQMLGSTGNIYTIHIHETPDCDCMVSFNFFFFS